MTATEFLSYQIETTGQMVLKCLNGFETSADSKAVENSMALGEQIEHLAEAYQAVITSSNGGEHEWGSFSLTARDVPGMIQEMSGLRSEAIPLVLKETDEALKMGADYIVAHDNYHLGQLVTLRRHLDPSWNMYEIYG